MLKNILLTLLILTAIICSKTFAQVEIVPAVTDIKDVTSVGVEDKFNRGLNNKSPKFSWDDIAELLKLAENDEVIGEVPKRDISSYLQDKAIKGMVALWYIEGIRERAAYIAHGCEEFEPRAKNFDMFRPLNPFCIKGDRPSPSHSEASLEIYHEVLKIYQQWWKKTSVMDKDKAAVIDPLEGSGIKWYGPQRWSEQVLKRMEEKKTNALTVTPRIQMAILLDTSGSMSGLINQARTELWSVVNEFITVKRGGITPRLDVALYQYGHSGNSSAGHIRQIVPFTNDLDKISKELFVLKTGGSREYCGTVIKHAVENLNWSKDPDDLKVIFIAGNEPFTQGPVNYKDACKAAIEKSIIVNTIHCGDAQSGIAGMWKAGSLAADGTYLCINHNSKAVEIAAPQDAEIVELSTRLNDTYIAYGLQGRVYLENQVAQDNNSRRISASNAATRAATKSSQFYLNYSWDVVDALKNDKLKLEDLKDEDLPEEMKKLNKDQRNQYVQKKAKERQEIQTKIQTLNQARKKYIAAETKKLAGADKSLGSAMIKAVRKQAENRNFKFEQTKPTPEKK